MRSTEQTAVVAVVVVDFTDDIIVVDGAGPMSRRLIPRPA